MLVSLRRLRLAHLVAFLAIILLAGLGQHAHASAPIDAATGFVATGGDGCAGDGGGDSIPSETHCAACHVVRGTLPEAVVLREPALLGVTAYRPAQDIRPDMAVPDGPARPPRPPRAA